LIQGLLTINIDLHALGENLYYAALTRAVYFGIPPEKLVESTGDNRDSECYYDR
jgi:hypothetical protein